MCASEVCIAAGTGPCCLTGTAHTGVSAPLTCVVLLGRHKRDMCNDYRTYADSKVKLFMFTAELQRRLRAAGSSTDVFSVHPGEHHLLHGQAMYATSTKAVQVPSLYYVGSALRAYNINGIAGTSKSVNIRHLGKHHSVVVMCTISAGILAAPEMSACVIWSSALHHQALLVPLVQHTGH